MTKISLVLIAFALISCQKKNETPETLSPELASYEQKSASDSSNVTSTQNSAPITMNNSAPAIVASASLPVTSSTSIRTVERGINTIGFARTRNGRSPLGSPNPAILCMGRFCSSRPLPLSTMLYLKSIALLLAGVGDVPVLTGAGIKL